MKVLRSEDNEYEKGDLLGESIIQLFCELIETQPCSFLFLTVISFGMLLLSIHLI